MASRSEGRFQVHRWSATRFTDLDLWSDRLDQVGDVAVTDSSMW